MSPHTPIRRRRLPVTPVPLDQKDLAAACGHAEAELALFGVEHQRILLSSGASECRDELVGELRHCGPPARVRVTCADPANAPASFNFCHKVPLTAREVGEKLPRFTGPLPGCAVNFRIPTET